VGRCVWLLWFKVSSPEADQREHIIVERHEKFGGK